MTPKKKAALSMQDTPLPKLIVGYALTTFCALFFDALYNLADTLFVGYGVGDDAMGGVSVVFPFMLFQGAVAQMIGGVFFVRSACAVSGFHCASAEAKCGNGRVAFGSACLCACGGGKCSRVENLQTVMHNPVGADAFIRPSAIGFLHKPNSDTQSVGADAFIRPSTVGFSTNPTVNRNP